MNNNIKDLKQEKNERAKETEQELERDLKIERETETEQELERGLKRERQRHTDRETR